MTSTLVPRSVLFALAGAALAVAASTGPSPAFTLSAPSLTAPVASAGVEHIWWDRWGRWHPNRPWGWRRWGWGPRPFWGPGPYGFYSYYGPVRRCWVGPWGDVRCRWV
jgi:hypothetical protein